MRFLIEFEGPLYNPAPAWHAAHQAAAAEVGWSSLDRATFWRLTRTQGMGPHILPGARDAKWKDYEQRFQAHRGSDPVLAKFEPQEGIREHLATLAGFGPCVLVTLGADVAARSARAPAEPAQAAPLPSTRASRVGGRPACDGLDRFFTQAERLSPDPRRRPGELAALAAGERRTLVVAGTDAILRAANEAGLFTVGVSCGTCSIKRLHAAGAGVVYGSLADLAASLQSGASDLIRAGLPPASLG